MDDAPTWIGVAIALVALAGTVANNYFQRVGRRDQLEFDQKTRELETRVQTQGEAIERCEEDRNEIRAELKTCEAKHDSVIVRLAQIEKRLGGK